ncbi:energy transducer TonB [Flavobacterium sp.]|uniref:energy transducer TonB n=1 Tax=Flavobacterium sp. TaxID=239 RepID=UPI003264885A
MSKLSLYETKWTDLVFENKNKEYGAYQLRQESSKTSFSALFLALLLIATLASVFMLISKFQNPVIIATIPTVLDEVIRPVDLNQIVPPETEEAVTPPQEAAVAAPISSQLVNPTIVSTEQAYQEIAPNTDNRPVVDNTSEGTRTIVNALPSTGGGGGEVAPSTRTNEPVLINELDKLPEFPGGMSKFYTYVGNNFNRPELDADRTMRVYVSFVIEKDGSMTDIIVKQDPGYGLGKEAIRVLKSLKTKWTPGMINSKPVRTAYNLPITIKVEAE